MHKLETKDFLPKLYIINGMGLKFVKVTGYSCARRAKCIGKCNLWYKQREQPDSGGGGALSQGAGFDGSFYRYAVG